MRERPAHPRLGVDLAGLSHSHWQAAFIADDSAIDVDDPEFWTKILPEMDQKDPSLDDYIMKRRATKQVSTC